MPQRTTTNGINSLEQNWERELIRSIKGLDVVVNVELFGVPNNPLGLNPYPHINIKKYRNYKNKQNVRCSSDNRLIL